MLCVLQCGAIMMILAERRLQNCALARHRSLMRKPASHMHHLLPSYIDNAVLIEGKARPCSFCGCAGALGVFMLENTFVVAHGSISLKKWLNGMFRLFFKIRLTSRQNSSYHYFTSFAIAVLSRTDHKRSHFSKNQRKSKINQ